MPNTLKLIITAASLVLIVSCTSGDPQDQQIDYAEIPLIKLDKEFSITESEDYLPARVFRVMVSDEGKIIISQRAENSLHQFDARGNYLGRIAGPGRGPGELSRNANPHFDGHTLVMSNNNGMFTVYQPNEEGLYEYVTDHLVRPPGYLVGLRSEDFSSFYVRADSARTPFGEIPPEFTIDFIHIVSLTADSIEVQEEAFKLESHSSYVEIQDGGNRMSYSSLPYRYSDHFTSLKEGKVMITRPKRSLIQIYDRDQNVEHELQLKIKPRPFTEADENYHFKDMDRTEIRDRMKMVKEFKPPFTGAFMDDKNRFWLSTDKSEAGSEYVILNYDGEVQGRILLPSGSSIHAVRNEMIYVLNDPYGLPSVDVYSLQRANDPENRGTEGEVGS